MKVTGVHYTYLKVKHDGYIFYLETEKVASFSVISCLTATQKAENAAASLAAKATRKAAKQPWKPQNGMRGGLRNRAT